MDAEQMWNKYKNITGNINKEYQSWAFGFHADLLADLVAKGEKTATASAYLLYEMENELLPKLGSYNIILDSKNNAICITQTTKVYVESFNKISKEHAFKEGEGDKSLAYWRKEHEKFFAICMNKIGKEFSEDMKVVCEEFEVVFKI